MHLKISCCLKYIHIVIEMFTSFPRIQTYSIMRNIIVRKCETASATLIKQNRFSECKKQWLALSFGNLTTILGGSYYLNNRLSSFTTEYDVLKNSIDDKIENIEQDILNITCWFASGINIIEILLSGISSIITINWIVMRFNWF